MKSYLKILVLIICVISQIDIAFAFFEDKIIPTTIIIYQPINLSNISDSTWYNISNWNTAYSWGNHAGLYLPISTKVGNTTAEIRSVFSSSPNITYDHTLGKFYVNGSFGSGSSYDDTAVRASIESNITALRNEFGVMGGNYTFYDSPQCDYNCNTYTWEGSYA